MFSFLFSIFILFIIIKFLVHLGFGITKLVFSLIAICFAFVLIPISIALIIPIAIFVGFSLLIAMILKAAL